MARGFVATVAIAAAAVTVGTYVQFDAASAPRAEAWKWFAQWLVPADPFAIPPGDGMGSFQSARLLVSCVSSYPHVLLAVTAFGVAFLLAIREPVEPRPDPVARVHGRG